MRLVDAHALGLARPEGAKPEGLQQRRAAMRSVLDAADVEDEETSDDYRKHEAKEEPPADAPVTVAPPSPGIPPLLLSEEPATGEQRAARVINKPDYAPGAAAGGAATQVDAVTQATPPLLEKSRSPRGVRGGAAA